jgi:hypothetical protein
MLAVSVSNLESFRIWKADEDLGLQWLLDRLAGRITPTWQMTAGEHFHKALENASQGSFDTLESGNYRFVFTADCDIALPQMKELRVSHTYADVMVRGRVDSLVGLTISDYKTTEKFDPERLLEGYQWRFYLDMMSAKTFVWNVFVLRQAERDPDEKLAIFEVSDVHRLEQKTYPGIHDDCMKLVREYRIFAAEQAQRIAEDKAQVRPTLEDQLRASIPAKPEESLGITEEDAAAVTDGQEKLLAAQKLNPARSKELTQATEGVKVPTF